MPTMPKSLFWARTDTAGADHVRLDDSRGLTAAGTTLAVDPIPFTCRYEVTTDEGWATLRLNVEVEGAGWFRSLRLERTGDGGWRAATGEQGDLDGALRSANQQPAGLPGAEEPDRLTGALDVDLSASPLFNVLPVRRLGLLDAAPGTAHRIDVAWVLVPSLAVVPVEQHYTALGGQRVRFAVEGFTADIELDRDGYVRRYPGLAERRG